MMYERQLVNLTILKEKKQLKTCDETGGESAPGRAEQLANDKYHLASILRKGRQTCMKKKVIAKWKGLLQCAQRESVPMLTKIDPEEQQLSAIFIDVIAPKGPRVMHISTRFFSRDHRNTHVYWAEYLFDLHTCNRPVLRSCPERSLQSPPFAFPCFRR